MGAAGSDGRQGRPARIMDELFASAAVLPSEVRISAVATAMLRPRCTTVALASIGRPSGTIGRRKLT